MTSSLPSTASPSVVLAVASPSEQRHAWRATHPSWGRGLTLAQYFAREEYLLTTALARDGGLTPWILTTTTTDSPRPVLSSCETLKKRAIVASPDGSSVTDVVAHGVASVFTEQGYRSRGYAGRMMALLGAELARREEASPGAARFSVLFSDIGPRFYANHQWKPMGNTHLAFPVGGGGGGGVPSTSKPAARITELTDQHLEALTARDEQLLRAQLSRPIAAAARHTLRVAVLPDCATLEWHFRREDHMLLGDLLGSAPARVRGALYTPPPGNNEADDNDDNDDDARRVWGFWVRSRSDGGSSSQVVTVLHFLRLVVEDDARTSDEELAAALDGIMEVARREAAGCGGSSVEMWNPSARVTAVFRERLPQLEGRIVQRDESSLASLRWFGAGSVDDVEWVANEKFAWC
ncbi:hypothetical protein BBO_05132 [Beauveria brongniartii RCEF 3172]|uniref:LYC1 C-terminal domain-containing protein n=1 Tax=Beauveria brongniartii RCEF 3172 TaxID=1081107 RepID=A0A167DJ68_9HYPO|nr:hypothetical protein BBO_05132 [Beauveria brongniartii RCEF 3172]